MSTNVIGTRERWAIAGSGGAVAVVLIIVLFSAPKFTRVPVPGPAVPTTVRFADSSPTNSLNREATAISDLAPLFLPTEYNATLDRMPRREAGKTFFDVETTKLSFTEAELRIEKELPSPVTLNGRLPSTAKPMDALASSALSPLGLGFNRSQVEVTPLPARGGYLEVVTSGGGVTVIGVALPVEVGPATEKAWQPLQFLASVNAAGLAGPLILTERSGVEEVDQHFRIYLAHTYRIGDRLQPGIYRITIGP